MSHIEKKFAAADLPQTMSTLQHLNLPTVFQVPENNSLMHVYMYTLLAMLSNTDMKLTSSLPSITSAIELFSSSSYMLEKRRF